MILIVDDYEDIGTALCRLLTRAGYACQVTTTGRDALAIIRSHGPEQPLLVVLDEMMPHMSGIEVLRALRDDPATASTAVIFYSAGFDLAKREEAMALGAVAWLLKGGGWSSDFDVTLKTITDWYQRVGGAPVEKAGGAKKPEPPPSDQSAKQ